MNLCESILKISDTNQGVGLAVMAIASTIVKPLALVTAETVSLESFQLSAVVLQDSLL